MLCVVCVHVVCGMCTCVWCVLRMCIHACVEVCVCLYVMVYDCYDLCAENCTGGVAHFLLAEIFIMFEVDELDVNEGDGLVELCLMSSEPFPEETILPVSFSGCSGDQCGEWDRAATGGQRGGGGGGRGREEGRGRE